MSGSFSWKEAVCVLQVVELGLPEGSQGVLGAALVPAAGGASRLLLLTSSELRIYECS